MNRIILINADRKQVGTMVLEQDGKMEISIFRTFSSLEADLHRLGETVSHAIICRKRSVEEKGAIIQIQERVEKGQEGYVYAVADFINSHAELVQPRVFAVVSTET